MEIAEAERIIAEWLGWRQEGDWWEDYCIRASEPVGDKIPGPPLKKRSWIGRRNEV